MSGRVVLAGGNGFLGSYLEQALKTRGYEPIILTRSPRKSNHVQWDGKAFGEWAQVVDGAAAVVNFTGRSVNCRYTEANRREIIESRVNSVSAIDQAVLHAQNPPPVLIQAASAAIYGDAGDQICDENTALGVTFSPQVCIQWEEAFYATTLPATRKVLFRIGFALGKDGGALQPLAQLTRFFLGGTTGSGKQYISWLHMDDLNEMFIQAIENSVMKGTYVATSTHPVTNAEFMRTLRQVLGRPWSPPVPSPLVRIGAMLMGTEAELALTGRRCMPRRLLDEGFVFKYSDLRQALQAVLG